MGFFASISALKLSYARTGGSYSHSRQHKQMVFSTGKNHWDGAVVNKLHSFKRGELCRWWCYGVTSIDYLHMTISFKIIIRLY